MNTRNIQPKTVWASNGEQQAIMLALINFSDYHFDDGGGNVTYKLIGIKDNEDMPSSAIDLFIGDIFIPSSIIGEWGQSDQIIWDYVCNQLNITLI